MRRLLDRTVAWSEAVECAVAIAGMTLILVLLAVQVFFRYVLNDPIVWVQEVVVYLFVWVGVLGISMVYKRRTHITVDVVVRALGRRGQRALGVLVHGVLVAFVGLLLVQAWNLHLSYGRFATPMLNLPKTVVTWPLLFSLVSMWLASVHFLVEDWVGGGARPVSKVREAGLAGDLTREPS